MAGSVFLTTKSARLMEALRQGDIFDEVGAAITGKELLREFYASKTAATARRRLDRFYAHATSARVNEVSRLARTVKRWELEIMTFFETHASNAGSEAMNLITEKLRRNAHGFRNFENYRLRLLLHSGVKWNTPSTARIRGRHPRRAPRRGRPVKPKTLRTFDWGRVSTSLCPFAFAWFLATISAAMPELSMKLRPDKSTTTV